MKKKLLLINPWIYDFSAFDLWSKPLGLLYIASFLRQYNFEISFIDCLDKYSELHGKSLKVKEYGTGHFHRKIVDKPDILQYIPRNFAKYGISESSFIEQLKLNEDVQAILVTSLMTYWYLGVKRVVELCRKHLPGIPVILGGIYASLLPEHAKKVIQPDFLIEGPGELKVLELLNKLFNSSVTKDNFPQQLDDYPYPAFDLVKHPDYMIIMTARGCPYNCTFCAQKIISMQFTQRNPDRVVEEIEYHYNKYSLRDFAFYDDALFINKSRHIEVILNKLIQLNLPIRLHAPNGLFANSIDANLAGLMFNSNFKTIRLSFETSNEQRRKDMYSKVSNAGMIQAVEHLTRAGFKPENLEAYVLMGLPNQNPEEIIGSTLFVHKLGLKVRLASFTPIPGTQEFERAVESGFIKRDIDPLLTNNSIFPMQGNNLPYDIFQKIKSFTIKLNTAVQDKDRIFQDQAMDDIVINFMRMINE